MNNNNESSDLVLLYESGVMLPSDKLECVVSAANMAGYMESAGKINVPNDSDLMKCIAETYTAWAWYMNHAPKYPDWPAFAEHALLREFGPNKMYILVKERTQRGFSNWYGDEATAFSEVIGAYSSIEELNRALRCLRLHVEDISFADDAKVDTDSPRVVAVICDGNEDDDGETDYNSYRVLEMAINENPVGLEFPL